MAKPKTRAAARPSNTAAEMDRLLLLDRLSGPAIPGILAAIALLAWVLNNAGVVPSDASILAAGAAALLLCLFFGVRPFLGERVGGTIAGLLGLFAVGLGATAFYSLYRSVFLPPAIVAADLSRGGAPLAVSTVGKTGPFRVVVEGHLPPSEGQASQSERYTISVLRGGAKSETFGGEFSEKWGTRRLGRRGTAPVRTVRDVDQHVVTDPDNAGFALSLDELVPAGTGTVGVKVHPDPFPTPLVLGLGALLTAGALALDAWRSVDPGEGVLTAFTLASLLAVASFRRFAPAHPGLPDLVFNSALGGLAGWAIASAAWAALRKPLGRWVRG